MGTLQPQELTAQGRHSTAMAWNTPRALSNCEFYSVLGPGAVIGGRILYSLSLLVLPVE